MQQSSGDSSFVLRPRISVLVVSSSSFADYSMCFLPERDSEQLVTYPQALAKITCVDKLITGEENVKGEKKVFLIQDRGIYLFIVSIFFSVLIPSHVDL